MLHDYRYIDPYCANTPFILLLSSMKTKIKSDKKTLCVVNIAMIYSKLATKTPDRRQWRHSGVFIVKFDHISRPFLIFLLLTLSNKLAADYEYSRSNREHLLLPIQMQQENSMRCSNNRDDLLQLNFTLNISILSEAYI